MTESLGWITGLAGDVLELRGMNNKNLRPKGAPFEIPRTYASDRLAQVIERRANDVKPVPVTVRRDNHGVISALCLPDEADTTALRKLAEHPELAVDDAEPVARQPAPKPPIRETEQGRQPRAGDWDRTANAPQVPAQEGNGFVHVYNFVPAIRPPWMHGGPLADRPAPSHGQLAPDGVSGTLTVAVTTEAPLVIVDPSTVRSDGNEHNSYGVRKLPDGKPDLPPTSLKGALRSAFEIVTSSRMPFFGHDRPLRYRGETSMGLDVVPVRITLDAGGRPIAQLLTGTHPQPCDGEKNPLYAAAIPRFWERGQYVRVRNPLNAEVNARGHLAEVCFDAVCQTHPRRHYRYWQVTKIHAGPVLEAEHGATITARGWLSITARGWLSITGPTIPMKHDERIFFFLPSSPGTSPVEVPVDHADHRRWVELVAEIRELNEIADAALDVVPNSWRPDDLPVVAGLSPAVWDRRYRAFERSSTKLPREGLLMWALVEQNANTWKLLELLPSMISRRAYQRAPDQLLPENILPPTRSCELSPADRLFGLVRERGDAAGLARRGRLRITRVETAAQVEGLGDPGTPLSILSSPKPAQGRFYAARNQAGDPPRVGVARGSFYRAGTGLRGRKVYVHFTQRGNTWTRQGGTRDKQNHSIREWVPPRSVFTVSMRIEDVPRFEAGALLWLLGLGTAQDERAGAHLRLGGGKPLGLGSVTLSVAAQLSSGASRARAWAKLGAPTCDVAEKDLVAEFRSALMLAWKVDAIEHVPPVRDFLYAAKGAARPAYPYAPPGGIGSRIVAWFVENERSDSRRHLRRTAIAGLPLPPIGDRLHKNPRDERDARLDAD